MKTSNKDIKKKHILIDLKSLKREEGEHIRIANSTWLNAIQLRASRLYCLCELSSCLTLLTRTDALIAA